MSAVAVTDPRGLTIKRWSALAAASLQQFGNVPNSTTIKDWMGWAQSVRSLPTISALNIPDPRGFEDWRLWAFRLNEGLLLL